MAEKKEILLVEDEPALAEVLQLKLSNSGLNVTRAQDGKEALDLIMSGKRFDLAIMDLMMPVMGGYEVLAELRSKNIQLPVIVMSSLGQKEDKERATQLGAVDFLVKTQVTPTEIANKIQSVIS